MSPSLENRKETFSFTFSPPCHAEPSTRDAARSAHPPESAAIHSAEDDRTGSPVPLTTRPLQIKYRKVPPLTPAPSALSAKSCCLEPQLAQKVRSKSNSAAVAPYAPIAPMFSANPLPYLAAIYCLYRPYYMMTLIYCRYYTIFMRPLSHNPHIPEGNVSFLNDPRPLP